VADIDDAWFTTDQATGKRVPTARHGTGKRWLARWSDAGRQRKKSFAKKEDAKRFLAQIEADQSRGVYVDPALGRTTVAEYGDRWRGEQLHRDTTADRVERAFRLHIDPVLGHLPLAQVRSGHVQAWVKAKSAELSPSTLRVTYSYLAQMFHRAAVDRLIGISPCSGIRLPDVGRHELVISTPEQIHALAEALAAHYAAVPYVAAATGLRGGELFGLELDAVDFLRREVEVRQQLTVLAGRKPYLAQVKTKTSRRVVSCPRRRACRWRATWSASARRRSSWTMRPIRAGRCAEWRSWSSPTPAAARSTALPGRTPGRRRSPRPACRPGSASTGYGTSTPPA
jgi:integrase